MKLSTDSHLDNKVDGHCVDPKQQSGSQSLSLGKRANLDVVDIVKYSLSSISN